MVLLGGIGGYCQTLSKVLGMAGNPVVIMIFSGQRLLLCTAGTLSQVSHGTACAASS